MTHSVAVIGAGAAGLKAATDLVGKNVEVDVYEATGRAGGRVLTSLISGDKSTEAVDLGAESFEAGERSEWVQELKTLDIITADMELTAPFKGVDERVSWYPNGKLSTESIDDVIFKSGYSAVEEQFTENVASARDIAVARNVDLDTPAAWVAFQISGEGPFSESIEPTLYSAQDRSRNESAAEDLRPFRDGRPVGIGSLFEAYAENLRNQDGANLYMPVRIAALDRRLEGGWTVELYDSSRKSYDALIITVSIGVLARSDFPLPPSVGEQLRAAIGGVQMGWYAKVGMVWPDAASILGQGATVHFYVNRDGTQAWQYTKLRDSEVIVASVAGTTALDLSDEQLGSRAVEVVRLTLPPAMETSPSRLVTSEWNRARAFRGAYSYSAVGAGGTRPELIEFVRGRFAPMGLFFAGEAFSLDLYGSLEATWFTGSDAAKRCLDLLSKLGRG